MSDEVCRCDAVLISWRAADPATNIHFTMKFADLLPNSLVRSMEDSTTESDRVISLSIVGRNSRQLQVNLLAFTNNDSIQKLLRIHDVKIRDGGTHLAVQGQDDVSFE